MKIRLSIGLIAAACLQSGFANTCAPIIKSADAYAKAERIAVKMSIVSQGQTHETEVLMAPEGMFIRGPDQWIQSPVFVDRKGLLDSYKATYTDCRRIGQETIDGVPTAIYRFTGKAEGEPPMTGKMWIGLADDLPRRLEGRSRDTSVTQVMRYDVHAPRTAQTIPGLNQLKGLFKR